MNKIIPFSKDITFKDAIGEITSIALDDTLRFIDDYTIKGELIVRGCNKHDGMEEDFSYPMPVDIAVDSKYDTSKCSINIDDFYYEILNENILKVKIDLMLDDLYYDEKPLSKENLEVSSSDMERKLDIDLDFTKDEDNLALNFNLENKKQDENKNLQDLFKETNDEKEYSIYRVYTILETDTLEAIMEKYKITKDDLSNYNDLSNFLPGNKLIIPSIDE